jgi:heme exporter protein D
MRLMVFPAAFMANTFAMMLVMIGLSLFGKPELAADFGLVHAATVALFYSFSGNARSLILGESAEVGAPEILRLRFLMVLPLSLLALMLCIGVVGEGMLFVSLLVARRAAEWLSEIFLSEKELESRNGAAAVFFVGQGVFSLLLLLALIDGGPFVLPITVLWALSPLLACTSGVLLKRCAGSNLQLLNSFRLLLPHFGSTAVIGVSVYFFRLFILLVAGKQVAGDLFSAFAMGGILGAVFAQALGPTMVRSERAAERSGFVRLFNLLLVGVLFSGVALGVSIWLMPGFLQWTLKGDLFWMAVSCSLIGGVVMVQAQRVRLRIIQDGAGQDVFGSDMLSNIMLVACIPFLFFGLGVGSLVALYLLGALLSWMFYASERNGLLARRMPGWLSERVVLMIIAATMFVPLFFQLESGVFVDTSAHFSSGGVLALLPIPLSVFACYVGIVLLGGFSQARLSLVSLFFVFIGMLLASLLVGGMQGGVGQQKLILVIQYILPMFALVLGQQFGSRANALGSIGRAAFGVLMVVVPVQLVATLVEGTGVLSPSLFIFSIYQYLQYVPCLFVALFLVAMSSLSGDSAFRSWLQVLALLMGAYVIFSWSLLALALLASGLLCLAAQRTLVERAFRPAISMLVLATTGAALALLYVAVTSQPETSGLDLDAVNLSARMLEGRLGYFDRWAFYMSGISGEWILALLGHAEPPSRDLYPSALNYYLDFAYNFGLIGMLPLMVLAGYTIVALIRLRRFFWVSPAYMGLAGVVLFILVVDSGFKVGLRQPYPGIIMFFLWGVLLALISSLRNSNHPCTIEREV